MTEDDGYGDGEFDGFNGNDCDPFRVDRVGPNAKLSPEYIKGYYDGYSTGVMEYQEKLEEERDLYAEWMLPYWEDEILPHWKDEAWYK